MNITRHIAIVLLSVILASCGSENASDRAPATPTTGKPPAPTKKAAPTAKVLPYQLVQTLPHDDNAFTQGLVVHNGAFLESTGQRGSSELRRVNIMTGSVLERTPLEGRYFGEGMTVLNGTAYYLTWMGQQGFTFDAATLERKGSFPYMGEGWGLTTDGTILYMSNGTDLITVRDRDFRFVSSFRVTRDGRSQSYLNELEWINGEIWANVWQKEEIVRIDPATGVVKSVVDLTGILPEEKRPPQADVLNGIAYDSTTKAIYVTGKNWPHVFQIEVSD